LVKTALTASDANWGRILAAVGRAGLNNFDINKVQISLNSIPIVMQGARAPSYTEEQGQKAMQSEDIEILIQLNRGDASETVWTTDLSYEYVQINAEYRT
jgi:glutamate N-acetyltransferase/amino-acid N-acetyltransferase